jgi:hypothetical protein
MNAPSLCGVGCGDRRTFSLVRGVVTASAHPNATRISVLATWVARQTASAIAGTASSASPGAPRAPGRRGAATCPRRCQWRFLVAALAASDRDDPAGRAPISWGWSEADVARDLRISRLSFTAIREVPARPRFRAVLALPGAVTRTAEGQQTGPPPFASDSQVSAFAAFPTGGAAEHETWLWRRLAHAVDLAADLAHGVALGLHVHVGPAAQHRVELGCGECQSAVGR